MIIAVDLVSTKHSIVSWTELIDQNGLIIIVLATIVVDKYGV